MAKPGFNYSSLDYDAIKAALQSYLQAKFPDTWKNIYESDIGVIIMEIIAYTGDVLNFYINHQARETYLPTARDRESVVNICKIVGYQLRNPTAASVACTATLDSIQGYDVLISKGTKVISSSGVAFEVADDYTIPAGSTSEVILLTAGETVTYDVVSDGSKFQRILVPDPKWIEGTIEVEIDGTPYRKVDFLVDGDETSTIFTIDVAANQNFYICFGDGKTGVIPPVGSTITIKYRKGGGRASNIPIGDIKTIILGKLQSSPPQDISVSLYNHERGSGGEDAETVEDAKLWAPKWARTNGRAVTAEDFNTLATKYSHPVFGSLARASAVLKREVPELNTVLIYGWSRDNEGNFTTPSAELKQAVEDYFNNDGEGSVRLITVKTEVVDGEVVYCNIEADVRIDPTYAEDVVRNNVSTALRNLFDNAYNQPGEPIRISAIYDAITSVAGVLSCVIRSVKGMVEYSEIIGTGDGTKQEWAGQLETVKDWGIVPGEFYITDGTQIAYDDGKGNLIGNVDNSGENYVVYEDKAIRGEFLGWSNPSGGPYTGTLANPGRIVPGTVLIRSDYLVIRDNSGKLVGDVDPSYTNTIDYDTGAYQFKFRVATNAPVRADYFVKERGEYSVKFAVAPANGTEIKAVFRCLASRYCEDSIGTGDNKTKKFSGSLIYAPAFRKSVSFCDVGFAEKEEVIGQGDGGATYTLELSSYPVPGSVIITAYGMTVFDNGYGRLYGDVDATALNEIDYNSKKITVTFSDVVPSGVDIVATYKLPKNQIIYDDSFGGLYGAVETNKVSVIDYRKGAFEVHFSSPPASGDSVIAHYLSLLDSASVDLILGKNQLATFSKVYLNISK